ncbi:hypothetical protein SDC9_90257 [bioreactor metagenome]|uniref:IPTL-CTERM protein sorting domain-containing protein n=1 Tax=bioreactor metagenome TaxID=1076179 RepID=A0A644ZRI8_9ZZZZ
MKLMTKVLVRAIGCVSVVCLVAPVFAQATNVAPPPPPVLTCNNKSTTPGVVKDLRQVFNTAKPGQTYTYVDPYGAESTYAVPGDAALKTPQSYWQGNVETWSQDASGNARKDGTTGSRNFYVNGDTASRSPLGSYNAAATLPTFTNPWIVMGDSATSSLAIDPEWSVGFSDAKLLNPNPNVMYYYKFTFVADSDMDLDQFGIRIGLGGDMWRADDRIKGIYVNNTLVRGLSAEEDGNAFADFWVTPGFGWAIGLPNNTSWIAQGAGRSAIWQAGTNTVTFAVLNVGLPYPGATNPLGHAGTAIPATGYSSREESLAYGYAGAHAGTTLLRVLGATTVQDCTPQPEVSTPLMPSNTLNSADPLRFSGTVNNNDVSATTVEIVVFNDSGDIFRVYPVTITPDPAGDPTKGRYAFNGTGPADLPPGDYLAYAQLMDPNGGAEPIAWSPGIFEFTVTAPTITMDAPPSIPENTANTIEGTVGNPGVSSKVDVVVYSVAADGTQTPVGTYQSPLDSVGHYTVTTGPLPAGNYNAVATINGMPVNGPSASGLFAVTAITMAPPPTVTSVDPSTITGTVRFPGTATTANVQITDSQGKVVWQGVAPLDPAGAYSVQASALPTGDYTVTSSANGATASAPLKVIDPPTKVTVTAPPTLSPQQAAKISGTVTYPGAATTVDLKIMDSKGSMVWQGSAALNSDGSYSSAAKPLEIGNYTVTATANGTSATTSFNVVDMATAVPTLGQWALVLLSMLMAGLGLWKSGRPFGQRR